jgi:hypothetical protein
MIPGELIFVVGLFVQGFGWLLITKGVIIFAEVARDIWLISSFLAKSRL